MWRGRVDVPIHVQRVGPVAVYGGSVGQGMGFIEVWGRCYLNSRSGVWLGRAYISCVIQQRHHAPDDPAHWRWVWRRRGQGWPARRCSPTPGLHALRHGRPRKTELGACFGLIPYRIGQMHDTHPCDVVCNSASHRSCACASGTSCTPPRRTSTPCCTTTAAPCWTCWRPWPCPGTWRQQQQRQRGAQQQRLQEPRAPLRAVATALTLRRRTGGASGGRRA